METITIEVCKGGWTVRETSHPEEDGKGNSGAFVNHRPKVFAKSSDLLAYLTKTLTPSDSTH